MVIGSTEPWDNRFQWYDTDLEHIICVISCFEINDAGMGALYDGIVDMKYK